MLIRAILLLACITLWLPTRADAQLAGKAIAVPNTEVNSLTAPNGRIYKLYVNLPENYATSGSTMYPVLYLTDAELEVMGIYAGIGYFLQLTGRIRDVILVGVADGSVAVHQGLRRLDYTPTRMPPDSTTGGADEFLTFLRDVAIPLIEDRHRADSGDRGLLGYSFGGLLGAQALLNRPGMFHRFLLTSPSVHWNNPWLHEHRRVDLEGDLGDLVSRLPGLTGMLENGLGTGRVELAVDLAFLLGDVAPDPDDAGQAGQHLFRPAGPFFHLGAGQLAYVAFDDVPRHGVLLVGVASAERR